MPVGVNNWGRPRPWPIASCYFYSWVVRHLSMASLAPPSPTDAPPELLYQICVWPTSDFSVVSYGHHQSPLYLMLLWFLLWINHQQIFFLIVNTSLRTSLTIWLIQRLGFCMLPLLHMHRTQLLGFRMFFGKSPNLKVESWTRMQKICTEPQIVASICTQPVRLYPINTT